MLARTVGIIRRYPAASRGRSHRFRPRSTAVSSDRIIDGRAASGHTQNALDRLRLDALCVKSV